MHIIYTSYNWWSKRVIRTTNSSQRRWWRRRFRTQRRRCLIKHCFGDGVVVVVVAAATSVGVGVGINSIAGAGVIGNWIFRLLSATVALRRHCTCMYSFHYYIIYIVDDDSRCILLKSRLYYNNRLQAYIGIHFFLYARQKTRANCHPLKKNLGTHVRVVLQSI